jgi:hypothetical protein
MKLTTNRLAARDGLPAKPEAQLLASEDTHLYTVDYYFTPRPPTPPRKTKSLISIGLPCW